MGPIRLGVRGVSLTHLFFADDLLLLSSSKPSQLRLIKRLLMDFCIASGHKVSDSKTRVFVSGNVPNHSANAIYTSLGYLRTDNLGTYLGVPLIHRRVNRDLFQYIIGKVRDKLSGWSAKSLSLVGRLTLAQSVLSAIPYYAMQVCRLPAATLQALQKLTRDFVWGKSDVKTGISLLSWSDLCQPKDHGGCGLKIPSGQNSAFLMKLMYQLHTEPTKLWVQVLRRKYNWTAIPNAKCKGTNASHLWRQFALLWDEFSMGLSWSLGNGEALRFWSDNWLNSRGPLRLLAFRPFSDSELNLPISHFVSPSGAWRPDLYEHALPSDVLLEIAQTSPPLANAPAPTPYWSLEPTGYSVRSGYSLAQQDLWNEPTKHWQLAWQWPGPQKIRTFLWLALGNRLLTNAVRHSRHMTDSTLCDICPTSTEDLDHVLRGCTNARACWQLLLPRRLWSRFFTMPSDEWLRTNLKAEQAHPRWRILFAIVCWKLWLARNLRIFQHELSHPHRLLRESLVFVNHIVTATEATKTLRLTS